MLGSEGLEQIEDPGVFDCRAEVFRGGCGVESAAGFEGVGC